jgi:alpha-L-arabinofuranosidase
MRILSLSLNRWLILFAAVATGAVCARGEAPRISVSVDKPAHKIPPTLWGIFFEDINMSSDGGIYPEMVRNRSFEDSDDAENWKFKAADGSGEATVVTADVHAKPPPLNPFNRKFLRIKAGGAFTLQNEGYWGMNIVSGEHYTFKAAARSEGYGGKLRVRLLSANGTELASGDVSDFGNRWKYATLDLTATGSDPKAKLEISGDGGGTLYLDMVSLMPVKTFKDHGLRTDLAESLEGLHPRFMRFPGGCWVEGDDFAHMNHWKTTVGDIDVRTPLWNIWGYNATQGLGFYEYLQLAEDIGAEPLFCINVGMSHKESVPMDRMGQWVQDALDAIEYANGPTNSVWGAMRAAAGHPEPFHLKYMEIGNENGGPVYKQHWPLFVNAIHAKYPEVQFVADHWQGGYPKEPRPDIVDEHFYDSPEWFMRNANHFDKYDRNGPKIFVGEYAVTRKCGLGNLRGAIGEAAFMTGLERNSDEVIMASYAPLLVNLNHRAWNPDLINFDSAKWYGLPGYYVQKMFGENRGDDSLPVEVKTPTTATAAPSGGKFGVGTWNTAAEFKDVKATSPDGKVLFQSDFTENTDGWRLLGSGAAWTVKDGALQQTAQREFIRALAGKRDWSDYDLTLKARKISGAEGFLILFSINNDEDRNWWNIGGWGNTQDAIEADGMMDAKPSEIATGKWYDIRVEVRGAHVKCFLDGTLVHDVTCQATGTVSALYACAARDERNGDVILKVVNAANEPLSTQFNLAGNQFSPRSATAIVLTSGSSTDENSLAEPMKVSPKSEDFQVQGSEFSRELPGNSFTVFRIHGQNR